MDLSKARAELTVLDLDNWYKDVEGRFVNNPKFQECFTDPRRMFNQDETPLTWGVEHQQVLAVKLAAIGTEHEAFDLVLQERTPKNLAKRTTKRKVKD